MTTGRRGARARFSPKASAYIHLHDEHGVRLTRKELRETTVEALAVRHDTIHRNAAEVQTTSTFGTPTPTNWLA